MDVTDDDVGDFTQESPGMELLAGNFSGSVTMNAASPVGFPHFEEAKQAITPRIVGRPTREELKERNILPGGRSHPSLHAAAVSLERAKAADTLNRKIELRPSKEEVVQRNIMRDTDSVLVPERQQALSRLQLEKNLNTHFQTRPGVLDLMTHCIIEPPQGLDVRAFIKREKTPISGLRSSSGDDDVDADARGNNAQHLPASFSHEQGPPAPPPVPPPMPVGGHDTHDPSNRALSSMLGLLTRRTDSDNSYASHSSANAHGGMEQLSMPEPPSPATMLRKGKGPSAYQITSPRGFPVFESDVNSAHAAIMNDFEAHLRGSTQHATDGSNGLGNDDGTNAFEDDSSKHFPFHFDFDIDAVDSDNSGSGSTSAADTSWLDQSTQLPLAHGHIVQEQLLSQAKQIDPNLKIPNKNTHSSTAVPTPLLDIEAHARAKAVLHEQLKSATFATCDVRQRAQAMQDIPQLLAHHHHQQQQQQSLWQYQQQQQQQHQQQQQQKQQQQQQHGHGQQVWQPTQGPTQQQSHSITLSPTHLQKWQDHVDRATRQEQHQTEQEQQTKFAVPRSGSFGSSGTRGTSGAGKASSTSKSHTTKRPKIKKFTYHDYKGPTEKKQRNATKAKAKQKQVRVPPPSPNRRLVERQQAQYLQLQEMQKIYETSQGQAHSQQQHQHEPRRSNGAMDDVDDVPQRTLTTGHLDTSGHSDTSGHLRGHQRASSWGGGMNDHALLKSLGGSERPGSHASSPLTITAMEASLRQQQTALGSDTTLNMSGHFSPSRHHHLHGSLDGQRPFSFHGDSPLSAPQHFSRSSPHDATKEHAHPHSPTSSPSHLARGDGDNAGTTTSLMMNGLLDTSFSDLHDSHLQDLSMLDMDIGDVSDLTGDFQFGNGG